MKCAGFHFALALSVALLSTVGASAIASSQSAHVAPAPDYNGVGPLHFGMTAAQMRTAWGAPLAGEAPAGDPGACHYLSLREGDSSELLMVEGGRFVRVDVRKASLVAPGGGRVGMRVAQLRKL